MKKHTNPLDKIQIAAPCSADWNEMVGDDRKRHCSECKLNVYNLSEMTQREAENFLIKAEGRVCLRIYRRSDGTVLTQNCPVGWQAIKKRVSRTATAAFALIAGLFGGIFALESLKSLRALTNYKKVPEIFFETKTGDKISFGGITSNLPEIKSAILRNRNKF
ncbi:MAG: hypothetical protein M3Q99_11345 [Acidobacteriota bacterium]|nr:hypothetical protein [Acidobacteriota bacterium]